MKNNVTTSVNIVRDEKRSLNYIPTPNAIQAVDQICKDFKKGVRSFNIVGSYGTGKSSFLWAFQQSLSQEVGKYFSINLLPKCSAEFINIVGEYRSMEKVFAEQFSVSDDEGVPEKIFNKIFKKYQRIKKGNPILFLVIDEFGKFLEYATQHDPEKELYFIQQLSEFINNSDYNIVLLTTVHQNFDAYAVSLNSSQKQEWTKVKGRFTELTFNEPIEQLLFLASKHIDSNVTTKESEVSAMISLFNQSKAFYIDSKTVLGVAQKLFPMDIFAANILTMALQKYAQNERSLFSFLESSEKTGLSAYVSKETGFYNIANIYDYLIANFYSSINSRYNPDFSHWKCLMSGLDEVERTFDEDVSSYVQILKLIGLLNIFAAAGSVLDKSFLCSYSKYSLGIKNAKKLIENLEKKKIILFRNYSQRYVLFGGTDLDITSALIEAGNKVSEVTDLATTLNKYYDLPPIIAKEVSYVRGTPRLFQCEITDQPLSIVPEGEIDGFINLLFNERLKMKDVISHSKKNKEAILYGYYKNTKNIKERLFEIETTKRVIEENLDDKIALSELNEILVHQQNLLSHMVSDNFHSATDHVVWIFDGQVQEVSNKKSFNRILSKICTSVYDKSPIFKNELVNRHKISTSIYTAKKRYFEAMIEDWDKPDLGFSKDKFPPEKTIFYSLLKNNGIHLCSDNIEKRGKKKLQNDFHYLWDASNAFLDSAKNSKRTVSEFYDLLRSRPYKLKEGLLRFWVPTFLFIHREDFSLFNGRHYIPTISKEIFELMEKCPDKFEIKTFDIEGIKLDIFNKYRLILNQDSQKKLTSKTFIETIKPFIVFYKGLPEFSKKTRKLSKEALAVRDAIVKAQDPEHTFFEAFPTALGMSVKQLQKSEEALKKYVDSLKKAIDEIRDSYEELVNRLEQFIHDEILGDDASGEETFEFDQKILQQRYKNLRRHLLRPDQKTFVQRLDSQIEDRGAWISSLVQALIGKSLDKIEDEDEILICDKFKDMFLELDSLTELSEIDYEDDKEEVLHLAMSSFSGGRNNKLIRIPNGKSNDMKNMEKQLKKGLSKDKATNIVALATLLKIELEQ